MSTRCAIQARVMGLNPAISSKAKEDPASRSVELDAEKFRQSDIVEQPICWLDEYRSILSRFEKAAKNFGGLLK
ncbi:hypothetical protein [Thalassoglobus sp.]|uniref:hypothetical protein n=1 Tax=Thalassoglobus sp. TaxID=2795869 RepID=UPI003AA8E7C5